VEFDQEILDVNFLQPLFLDFVHSNIHCNESLIVRSDIIHPFMLEEINTTHNLPFLIRSYNIDDSTIGLFVSLLDNLEIDFILMNAPISILPFGNKITISLVSFYLRESLNSFDELDGSFEVLLLTFPS
jgi:hypothetical protein